MPVSVIMGTRITARVTWQAVQNIAGNFSTVKIQRVEVKANQGDSGTCSLTGSVYINAAQAAVMGKGCELNLSSSYAGGGASWSGWSAADVTIPHNDKGEAGAYLYVSLKLESKSGSDRGSVSGLTYIQMPDIPRASGITANGVELGQEMEIRLNRADMNFMDTVTWQCGEESGTLAEKTQELTILWTPPVSLAAQAPDSNAAAITLTVTTFDGDRQIGTKSTEVRCSIPDGTEPEMEYTVTDRLGYRELYGGFIQGQSQVRVVTQAEGAMGAQIQSIRVACGSLEAEGEDVTFALAEPGAQEIRVTVTDSRGKSRTETEVISVLAYSLPRAQILELIRCDSEGNAKQDGVYGRATFLAEADPLNGGNALTAAVQYRRRGSEAWDSVLPDGDTGIFPAGQDYDYECRILAQDSFGRTYSAEAVLPVAFALLDFNRSRKAMGMGTRATRDGTLSMGVGIHMDGHRIEGLPDPEEDGDAITRKALLDICYPVGTIYQSTVDVCAPAALGGTWERIRGKFLLAEDAGRAAGSTGGSESHTITAAEMPAHTHSTMVTQGYTLLDGSQGTVNGFNYSLGGSGRGGAAVTGSAGAANPTPISTMPPYLAVYMWKRTG